MRDLAFEVLEKREGRHGLWVLDGGKEGWGGRWGFSLAGFSVGGRKFLFDSILF